MFFDGKFDLNIDYWYDLYIVEQKLSWNVGNFFGS